jgi:hypothetical protein
MEAGAHHAGLQVRKAKTPMWALRQIVPLTETEQRQREAAKTAERREQRAADKAKRQDKLLQHENPRETAVLETAMRLSWNPSVADIMRAMNETERAAFPHGHASFKTIANRTAERLVKSGKLSTYGLRKSRRYIVRLPELL